MRRGQMRHIVALPVSALLIASCATGGAGSPTAPTTTSATTTTAGAGPVCSRIGATADDTPLPPDLEMLFDPVVADGMAAMEAVGLTLAVQCADSPLYVKGYGAADLGREVPAALETVYEIGSISKQFVAAEMLLLQQAGRLQLTDPIGSHLRWLPEAWLPITLEQLLSHTGGLPDHFAIFRDDPDTPFDWTRSHTAADILTAFVDLDDRLVASPGTTFSYSNTGYIILSAVIEQLTGHPVGDAMDEDLFAPLGLEHTAFCSSELPGLATGYVIASDGPIPGPRVPPTFYSGAAGLCATAGDLVRWERALIGGYVVGTGGFDTMSTPVTRQDGTAIPYGLGLHLGRLGSNDAVFHEGGTAAFSSWLTYFPEHDLVIAVLTNSLGPRSGAMRDLVIDLSWAARGR